MKEGIKEKIIDSIFKAVEEINQQLPQERRLKKSPDTLLFDESGDLDSLGLVNLVVLTEQNIEEELGVTITLTDGKAIAQKNNPFKTIGTLIDYIASLLAEQSNG